MAVTPELARSLGQEKLLNVQQSDFASAAEALRNGKVALVAMPGPGGSVLYQYDDTNPEGRSAVCWQIAQSSKPRVASTLLPRSDQARELGSRYIDFLIPGLLGMNLMGSAIGEWDLRLWTHGEEAAEAPQPHRCSPVLLPTFFPAFPALAARCGSRSALGFWRSHSMCQCAVRCWFSPFFAFWVR